MYSLLIKPVLDNVFALSGIVVLSPVYLVVQVLLFITQSGKVFFSQSRVGLNRRPFKMIKFRTMKGEDQTVAPQTTADRTTLIGSVLRRTSIDELPQLWNVLVGDMSFVGPRPLPVQYLPLFSEEQHKRHEVRPGITGWAQINGRHSISWQEKFALDDYYVQHISAGLDVLILFKTIVLLLSFKKDLSLAEEPFK